MGGVQNFPVFRASGSRTCSDSEDFSDCCGFCAAKLWAASKISEASGSAFSVQFDFGFSGSGECSRAAAARSCAVSSCSNSASGAAAAAVSSGGRMRAYSSRLVKAISLSGFFLAFTGEGTVFDLPGRHQQDGTVSDILQRILRLSASCSGQ